MVPGTVSYHRPSHAYLPKLKLPSLSLDFQESVQASIESEPTKVGSATSQPGKLLQETPPKSPSLPPDSQKITPAIIEANAAQISDVQTLKDILYNAYDVRFEVRDGTPCLLYKEQEEEKWVPIRVLKDMSDDSDKEYDLDYIRSCKQIRYFKRDKNGDPAVSIHRGKCKFPTPIAFRTRTRLKQTDCPNFFI